MSTVDYHPDENGDFPPPTTPDEVGARVIQEERKQEYAVVAKELEEMSFTPNENVNENLITAPADVLVAADSMTSQPAPKPPQVGDVLIRNYDPKQKSGHGAGTAPALATTAATTSRPDSYLISPITGERIRADKLAEHMRYATLDPRWAQTKEKEMREKMEQEDVYAPGGSVQSELKKLAERRTDIFGEGDQETIIGKKIGEEDMVVIDDDNRPMWDGHSSTVEKTTKKAMKGITIEDQILAIHRAHGIIEESSRIGPKRAQDTSTITNMIGTESLPPHSPPLPTKRCMENPPLPLAPPPPTPPKLPKPNEISGISVIDTSLMNELEFAGRYGGENAIISINVQLPEQMDSKHPEWALNGQTIQLTFPLMEKISNIKTKLTDEINVPPSKQKLQYQSTFMKDAHSLAYYNVIPGGLVNLTIKERGGRKK